MRDSNVSEICGGTAGSAWSVVQSAGDSERVDVGGGALILLYPRRFLKCRQIRAHCLFMPLSKPAGTKTHEAIVHVVDARLWGGGGGQSRCDKRLERSELLLGTSAGPLSPAARGHAQL